MPKNPESEGSRLITLKQIELEHGVSRSALHTYRRSASFPQPVPVEGSTKIQYLAGEVAAWFAAHPPQQGKRTDLAPEPEQQGDPVTTTADQREWRLTPETLDLFVRALVNEVDYDIHKNYECGEEDGADHYPELVAKAAAMLDAIIAKGAEASDG